MVAVAALTEQVRETMATVFMVDVDELPENISQLNYPRWTSLYHLTLLLALEEEFGTSFAMEEMTAMTSEDAIVTVLRGREVDSAS